MDDERIERLATLYAAVGEPTRLRILGLLAEREATGAELSDRLGLTPPTVSHHMAKLVSAGLVKVTPDAQRRRYRLDLAALRPPQPRGEPESAPPFDETAKILRDFFAGERLTQIPASRKKRVIILRHLLERFEPGRDYPEREVNDLLRPAHDDVATLRRELVDYGYLVRDRGIYRVAERVPERGTTVDQETGSDEPGWFAELLAGATERALLRSGARRA
jgi:hypothetical protein